MNKGIFKNRILSYGTGSYVLLICLFFVIGSACGTAILFSFSSDSAFAFDFNSVYFTGEISLTMILFLLKYHLASFFAAFIPFGIILLPLTVFVRGFLFSFAFSAMLISGDSRDIYWVLYFIFFSVISMVSLIILSSDGMRVSHSLFRTVLNREPFFNLRLARRFVVITFFSILSVIFTFSFLSLLLASA